MFSLFLSYSFFSFSVRSSQFAHIFADMMMVLHGAKAAMHATPLEAWGSLQLAWRGEMEAKFKQVCNLNEYSFSYFVYSMVVV